MNGKPFTESEDNQLRELHESGATVSHMAAALGRPYGSICTRRQHLGLSYRDGAGRGPAKQTAVEYEQFSTDAYDILPKLLLSAAAVVSTLIGIVAFGIYLGA